MKKGRNGFTLLEILLVVTLIGLFAAMILPLATGYAAKAKNKESQQTLDTVRKAILGPGEVYDKDGQRVFGGYVADMGELPRLFLGQWSPTSRLWEYDSGVDVDTLGVGDAGTANPLYNQYESGAVTVQALYASWVYFTDLSVHSYTEDQFRQILTRLQPVGLYDSNILEEDQRDNLYGGPYAAKPVDPFPNDVNSEDYSSGDAERRRRFFERSNLGRFSDAWGRSLLFFPYYDSTSNTRELWVISSGQDGMTSWDVSGTSSAYVVYDETADFNRDNQVIKISYADWDSHVVEEKNAATLETLEDIRKGIIGARNVKDRANRDIVGGFIGEMCRPPYLYEFDGSGATPTNTWNIRYYYDFTASNWVRQTWNSGSSTWGSDSNTDPDPEVAFPRGLWTRDPVADGSSGTNDDNDLPELEHGVGWRGEYVAAPATSADLLGVAGQNQRLRDAWGRAVYFFRDDEDRLLVASSGKDGEITFPASGSSYDAADALNLDNIVVTVNDADWRVTGDTQAFRFETTGTVINDDTRLRLYLRPNEDANNDPVAGTHYIDFYAPENLYSWTGQMPHSWQLLDGFNDSVLDTSRWQTAVTGGATCQETGGAMVMNVASFSDWAEFWSLKKIVRRKNKLIRFNVTIPDSYAGLFQFSRFYIGLAQDSENPDPSGSTALFYVIFYLGTDASTSYIEFTNTKGSSSKYRLYDTTGVHELELSTTYEVTIEFGDDYNTSSTCPGFKLSVSGASNDITDGTTISSGSSDWDEGEYYLFGSANGSSASEWRVDNIYVRGPTETEYTVPAGVRRVLAWEESDDWTVTSGTGFDELDVADDEDLREVDVVVDESGEADRVIEIGIP